MAPRELASAGHSLHLAACVLMGGYLPGDPGDSGLYTIPGGLQCGGAAAGAWQTPGFGPAPARANIPGLWASQRTLLLQDLFILFKCI